MGGFVSGFSVFSDWYSVSAICVGLVWGFLSKAAVSNRLYRYTAIFTISAKNGIGRFASSIIDLALVFND